MRQRVTQRKENRQSMVLITGGTGVMGSVLVKRLAASGKKCRVLTLPGDPYVFRLAGCDVEIRYGDISRPETVVGLCDGISTVYHLAAIIIAWDTSLFEKINVLGTKNVLAEAQKSGVEHLVYISSASIIYPKPTTYSLSKRRCEELVRNSGIEYTIIRPTLVYDKRAGAEEFDAFCAYLYRFPIIPFVGPGTALKRPVFVDDIISGLCALCDSTQARGKIYNFSGGEAISILEFARLCLRLMGKERTPVLCLPVWLCSAIARAMGLVIKRPPLRWQVIAGMIQDANLDPADACRDLGYNPAKVTEKLPECFPRYFMK
ncbi:MAG: NAD-dependent epimerase/dehydratase family protein [Chitinivibrionales bacterium]|nr:NAD-dependent epimerase/dehydratase family protein [Chitinivibrionales bacterium]